MTTNDDDESPPDRLPDVTIETHREWRMRAVKENGDAREWRAVTPTAVGVLRRLHRRIQEGELRWQSARLTWRDVTVTRVESPWQTYVPCAYDFAHTRNWCGNPTCRDG